LGHIGVKNFGCFKERSPKSGDERFVSWWPEEDDEGRSYRLTG